MCYTTLEPVQYFSPVSNDVQIINGIVNVFPRNNRNLEISTAYPFGCCGSMRPAIPNNAITIQLKDVSESDIHIGDIVIVCATRLYDTATYWQKLENMVYRGQKNCLHHRVVGIENAKEEQAKDPYNRFYAGFKPENNVSYITRGDNSGIEDDYRFGIDEVQSKTVGVLY